MAYAPAFDLSTCGETLEEARRRFAEAAMLFVQELHRKGTLNEVLAGLGWRQTGKDSSFVPPLVVGQENYTVPLRV